MRLFWYILTRYKKNDLSQGDYATDLYFFDGLYAELDKTFALIKEKYLRWVKATVRAWPYPWLEKGEYT